MSGYQENGCYCGEHIPKGAMYCSSACIDAAYGSDSDQEEEKPTESVVYCANCGNKPVYPGSAHCSRTCRNTAQSAAQQAPTVSYCTHCGNKPVHPGSAHCSRTCRNKAQSVAQQAPTVSYCANCGNKPVHLGSAHCSLTCRRIATGY